MKSNIRTVYVNGQYVPYQEACVHIDDRGYQFGDGVYEVIAVHNGKLIDGKEHIDRLEKSLHCLGISMPFSHDIFNVIMTRIIALNYVKTGFVYIQVTRGVHPRNHLSPSDIVPSITMYAKSIDFFNNPLHARGMAIETVRDHRWFYRNIKATGPLIANCMAKTKAHHNNLDDAWFINVDGFITEGSASNAWMVDQDGVVVTYPENPNILSGVVRARIFSLLDDLGIAYRIEPFTLSALKGAREAFSSASVSLVVPVVKVNDIVLGNGKPGAITYRILEAYLSYIRSH